MTPIIGRGAALVVAAGLLLLAGLPTRAATTGAAETASVGKPLALTKSAKPRVHQASRSRKIKHATAKVRYKTVTAAKPDPVAEAKPPMPDGVANANAQMTSPDARGTAEVKQQPALETAASEQRGELDRALVAAPPLSDDAARVTTQLAINDQPQTLVPAISPEPAPAPVATVVSRDTAWTQSSLIGKIFIAFGGMLTLASAARMLVA